jgi:preprotein translocase subunit SecY
VAGGGTARAALLAVGVAPYIAARVYLFIGRSLSKTIRRAAATEDGETRAVRGLTLGIAALQASGYVAFVSQIPNAVVQPGVVFAVRTAMLLTGGALAATLLAEQLMKRLGFRRWVGRTPRADDSRS